MKLRFFFLVNVIFSCTFLYGQNGLTEIPFGEYEDLWVNSFIIDQNDDKWMGTQEHGLAKLDNDTLVFYNTENTNLANNKVELLFEKNNHYYCILGDTYNKTIGIFDGTEWIHYNTYNGLNSNIIFCAYHDDERFYVGTDSGLCILHNEEWTYLTTENSPLESNRVTGVQKDLTGNLWIGTLNDTFDEPDYSGGLYKVDGDVWTKYDASNTIMASDEGQTAVLSFLVTSRNAVFIKLQTGEVFYMIDDHFHNLSDIFEWPLEGVEQFKESPGGNIFLSEKRGLDRYIYEIDNWELKMYYVKVIYKRLDFDSSNTLWFVGSYDYYYIHNLYIFSPEEYYSFLCQYTIVDNNNLRFLNVNNVNAGILNRGDMFWDVGGRPLYEVPKGSGKNSLFASGMWIGGLDDEGMIHGANYWYRSRGNDYFPGPLKIVNDPGETDTSVCKNYNKIWRIDRYDIENFQHHYNLGDVQDGSYQIPQDILTWPAHGPDNYAENLAPFVDVNQDGNYNPHDGDYPEIKGDQMLWWVFNDNLAEHTQTDGFWNDDFTVYHPPPAMGIEVQASAFAFTHENAPNDSINAINNTTFLNFKIYNRSDTTYDSVYVGYWTGGDLGDPYDDFVGSHIGLNSFYLYNGEEEDGDVNWYGYGINPPAQSVTFLNKPGEESPFNQPVMSSFLYYYGGSGPNCVPESQGDFYNYLRGIWKNGVPLTYGGTGYMDGEVPCKYKFPGDSDPKGYGTGGLQLEPWSEITEGNEPGDRRGVGAVGPFTLEAGEMVEFDVAFVWSRGDDGPMSSVEKLFADIENVIYWYENQNFPSNYNFQVSAKNAGSKNTIDCNIYPNPVKNKLQFDFGNQEFVPRRYRIYNTSGQLLTIGYFYQKSNRINVENLAKGIYIIEFSDNQTKVSQKFVKE